VGHPCLSALGAGRLPGGPQARSVVAWAGSKSGGPHYQQGGLVNIFSFN
jgi:hypothetical protein